MILLTKIELIKLAVCLRYNLGFFSRNVHEIMKIKPDAICVIFVTCLHCIFISVLHCYFIEITLRQGGLL